MCIIHICDVKNEKTYTQKLEIIREAKALLQKVFKNINFESFTIEELDKAKMYARMQIRDFENMEKYCERRLNELKQ